MPKQYGYIRVSTQEQHDVPNAHKQQNRAA